MPWGRARALVASATVAILAAALVAPEVAGAAGTGSFSPTGLMGTGRFGAAAAPLPGGRVLVMGGTPNNATDLKSSEIFDPATGTFAAKCKKKHSARARRRCRKRARLLPV